MRANRTVCSSSTNSFVAPARGRRSVGWFLLVLAASQLIACGDGGNGEESSGDRLIAVADDSAPPGGPGQATLRVAGGPLQRVGGSTPVCVELETGAEAIAGTQNELDWDADCATFVGCEEIGAHGKGLAVAQKGGESALRALVLSLTDVNPIADGPLYCCSFTFEHLDPSQCCPIGIRSAAASDPAGIRVQVGGIGAEICAQEDRGDPDPSLEGSAG